MIAMPMMKIYDSYSRLWINRCNRNLDKYEGNGIVIKLKKKDFIGVDGRLKRTKATKGVKKMPKWTSAASTGHERNPSDETTTCRDKKSQIRRRCLVAVLNRDNWLPIWRLDDYGEEKKPTRVYSVGEERLMAIFPFLSPPLSKFWRTTNSIIFMFKIFIQKMCIRDRS